MNDALIDEEGLSPERQSLLPGEGFFVLDSVAADRADAAAATALEGSDVAVVADPDADGLACVALIRATHGGAALIPTDPHNLERGLERVAEHAPDGIRLYVCDLCPDDAEALTDPLGAVVDRTETVRWFDHHQWDDAVAAAVRERGIDLLVGDSASECSADVALRALDHDFPAHLVDLVHATRDYDLWIRDDPRGDDLADFAHWADPEDYLAVVAEHGPDLPESVTTSLAEKRVAKEDRIDRAVRRAAYHEVGGLTIGVTYGRCAQNEVAEAMREAGADASVVVKPAGSASLRSTDAFDRCHEVAGRVNGGGHPKAAGCKPLIYADMLDYATHWTTQGAVAKGVILEAFRAVLEPE